MGHFQSNLRDLEFNLFEVHQIQNYLTQLGDVDRDTATDILREIDRLAREDWAESFVDADRIPLELVDGSVTLPDSVKASLQALKDGGWDRLGLSEELGGIPTANSLFWATQELLLGANPAVTFYAGGGLFASVLFNEGTEDQQHAAKLMMEKGWAGSMVLTEPDAGSDVGAGTTKATHVEADVYHIEGVKRFITSGEHDAAENIVHLVLARVPGAVAGTKGLSMFMVPKFLFDAEGNLGARNGGPCHQSRKEDGVEGIHNL